MQGVDDMQVRVAFVDAGGQQPHAQQYYMGPPHQHATYPAQHPGGSGSSVPLLSLQRPPNSCLHVNDLQPRIAMPREAVFAVLKGAVTEVPVDFVVAATNFANQYLVHDRRGTFN